MNEHRLRRSLRLVTLAWVFGAGWLYTTTGATLTQFAKLQGMPPFGYGLMAALPFFGALFQLPASYFVERFGHRKAFFITAGILHRGLWLVVAIIPWVAPSAVRWHLLIAVIALSWIAGQVIGPVWVSWMADLVPGKIRGRYFSRRSQLGQFVGLITTLAAGFVLDYASRQGDVMMLRMLAGLLALAAAAGISDFLFFLSVDDDWARKPNPDARFWEMLRTPLRDRNFRRFLGWTATLTFATGFMAQFAWLYVLDEVGMSNMQANAMLVLMPLVTVMLFTPVWGRLVDRFGRKPALLLAGTIIIPGSAAWIFIDRENWVLAYLVIVTATAAWPGIEIANFNTLLALNDSKGGSERGGAYVAINSSLNAFAGILSGLFGGALAQLLGNWRTEVFGWTLTYHGVLFLISSGLRVTALFWLFRLQDHNAGDTLAALRFLGTNIYSNVQQSVFVPGRLLQQLGRWTFPMNKRR